MGVAVCGRNRRIISLIIIIKEYFYDFNEIRRVLLENYDMRKNFSTVNVMKLSCGVRITLQCPMELNIFYR